MSKTYIDFLCPIMHVIADIEIIPLNMYITAELRIMVSLIVFLVIKDLVSILLLFQSTNSFLSTGMMPCLTPLIGINLFKIICMIILSFGHFLIKYIFCKHRFNSKHLISSYGISTIGVIILIHTINNITRYSIQHGFLILR